VKVGIGVAVGVGVGVSVGVAVGVGVRVGVAVDVAGAVIVGIAVGNAATGVAVEAGPHAANNKTLKHAAKLLVESRDFILISLRPCSPGRASLGHPEASMANAQPTCLRRTAGSPVGHNSRSSLPPRMTICYEVDSNGYPVSLIGHIVSVYGRKPRCPFLVVA
jgi:hypothetical protein